ncbi:uncharacterized protein RJT21DRAFT_37533 [Scheffersomyces amazonensis]|uniref:uncharacterized protein n=1 Tax=Scheffersomyces amazonensis TaxID=1078765 RepID=UPI00315CBCFE
MRTTFVLSTALSIVAVLAADDNPYATYPSVAKTASINGFADKIYDQLPSCAKDCVKQNTGITPCPYWDTGCLCVMPQFGGLIAECIAESCKGAEVVTATSLASSICSSAGVWEPYWMIPASLTEALDSAAANTTPQEDKTTPQETAVPETTVPETIANETTPKETTTSEAAANENTTNDTKSTTETTIAVQNSVSEVNSQGSSTQIGEPVTESSLSAVDISDEATTISSVESTSATSSEVVSVEQANNAVNNYPGAVLVGSFAVIIGLLL